MMNTKPAMLLCLLTILANLLPSPVQGQESVDFVKQIKPIFEKYCYECHGADPEDYEAFPIDDREEAMAYVDVDSIDDSDLYQVTVSDDEDWVMPPPDYKHQLDDSKKALIKQWIEAGADWPDDVKFVVYQEKVEATSEDRTADADDQESTSEPGKTEQEPGDATEDAATTSEETGAEKPAVPAGELDTQTYLYALGSLHPAAVHLPIGLLMAAGLFALFSLRGNFVMSDCAYYCLWLGCLGAIAATASGWYFSEMENKGTVNEFKDIFDATQKVYWHRLGALIITIFSFILALFAASARSRDPDEGSMWKLGAILLAGGVAWVGHTGGELHYPPSHYKELNQVWNSLTADMFGNADQPANDEEGSEDSGEESDEGAQVGTTSSDTGDRASGNEAVDSPQPDDE